MDNVLDACISIMRGRGGGLGPGTRELRIRNYSSLLFILLSSPFPLLSPVLLLKNLVVLVLFLLHFPSTLILSPPSPTPTLLNNLLPVYIIHGSQSAMLSPLESLSALLSSCSICKQKYLYHLHPANAALELVLGCTH